LLFSAGLTLLAFLADWLLGDPPSWPHPVRLIGRLITRGESLARAWAAPARLLAAGAVLTLAVTAAVMGAVTLVLHLSAWIGPLAHALVTLYLVYSLLCLRDLYHQTWRVEKILRSGGLSEARAGLALVVGRDTAELSEAGVRRALIETLAENLSDGLVAPLFYLALGGPVLAWGFKAVNTLDSMIGYKNERYMQFGRFAAKLDDLAGFLPARLSAWLLIAAAGTKGFPWRAARDRCRRDGGLHPSPNAGRPEAAMAGALGLCLGGPSTYGGQISDKPFLNPEGGEPGPEHLAAAESLVIRASLMMLAAVLPVIAFFSGRWGW
jgi:adenosylcobinamide-phosphate synthase